MNSGEPETCVDAMSISSRASAVNLFQGAAGQLELCDLPVRTVFKRRNAEILERFGRL
jgi:hypothetical protein